MKPAILLMALLMALTSVSCKGKSKTGADTAAYAAESDTESVAAFSGDSAYLYVKTQCDFGPRVPNTEAHRKASAWLASELERHGAQVMRQPMTLKAFDGTTLNCVNIFGRFNPEKSNRLLLLAHYDSRPWADEDPDPAKRSLPVMGANDGASGVGVLLEAARQIAAQNLDKGVDILFVDAEDWGDHDNDDSWAMGTRYFVQNPILPNYHPDAAILLDMVGGIDARFPREYFSQTGAPELLERFWICANNAGLAHRFPNTPGGAITDDHVQLLRAGIPAIDIIELDREGFNPTWHTTSDTIENIDKGTLQDVGTALMNFIINFN